VRDGCGLGADVLGRTLDEQLIAQFEAAGIDACGEEGEYHTLVIDGPLFERRIEIVTGASYAFDGHQLLELALA
jgi:diphthamide synthase (EF-2-diphthine--ammonia ligase)